MANNDSDVNTGTQDTEDVSSTTENTETGTSSLIDAMKADPELNGGNDTTEEATEEAEEQPDQTETTEETTEEEADDQGTESDESEELSEEEMSRLKGKTQTRIRGLAAENRALRDQVAALEGQRNVPHTVDEYVEAGYSEVQAEMAAMKEQMAVEKENSRVAQLNANMHEDGVNAEHDYPIFNEKSAEYDKDFAEAVGADYRRYANLQTDPTGQYILRADIPLYDFYKSAAERYERGLSRGRTTGAAAAAKQAASADQTPVARPAPKTTQQSDVDRLLSGMRSRLPN